MNSMNKSEVNVAYIFLSLLWLQLMLGSFVFNDTSISVKSDWLQRGFTYNKLKEKRKKKGGGKWAW